MRAIEFVGDLESKGAEEVSERREVEFFNDFFRQDFDFYFIWGEGVFGAYSRQRSAKVHEVL